MTWTCLVNSTLGIGHCVQVRVQASCVVTNPLHGHVRDTLIVNEGGHDDQDVKDLMTLEPDVALARNESFRNPGSVQEGAGQVQGAHDDGALHGELHHGLIEAFFDDEVDDRSSREGSQTDKGQGSVGSEFGQVESVPQGDDDGQHTQDGDGQDVGELGIELTVKAKVKPGYDTAHNQDGNACIVKSGEETRH